MAGNQALPTRDELSIYYGENQISELTKEQKKSLLLEIYNLVATVCDQIQNKNKIDLVLSIMSNEGWGVSRVKSAFLNFVKTHKGYYDKWLPAEILSFNPTMISYSRMNWLCHNQGRSESEFIRVENTYGTKGYWDTGRGSIPSGLRPAKAISRMVAFRDRSGNTNWWDENVLGKCPYRSMIEKDYLTIDYFVREFYFNPDVMAGINTKQLMW